jgi:DNA-binding response OmpR family regulator
MSLSILVYGPDERTNEEVARQLHNDGYAVNTATKESEALRKLHADIPGLIVVDMSADGVEWDGARFCQNVRAVSEIPVALIADPESEEAEQLAAQLLEHTYLVEMPARRVATKIEEILGRTVMPSLPTRMSLHVHEGLWVDFATRQVRVKGEAIDLTPKEFDLLSCLVRNAGRLFTSEELIDLVWDGKKSDRAALKAYIWRLRQKIEETPKRPRYILTRRGVGYFFKKMAS